MRFEAVDESPTSGRVLCDWYRLMGKEGILQDTMANTRLLLRAKDTLYLVRSCAPATILRRTRIFGHALSKASKPVPETMRRTWHSTIFRSKENGFTICRYITNDAELKNKWRVSMISLTRHSYFNNRGV